MREASVYLSPLVGKGVFKEHVALSLPWEDRAVSSARLWVQPEGRQAHTKQVRDVPKDNSGAGERPAKASEGRDGTLRVVGAREPSIAANILDQKRVSMRSDVNCCSERVNAAQ